MAPLKQQRTATVLIAKASDSERSELGRLLKSKAIRVLHASTAREALERITAIPDLVIVDLHLPDMEGSEVCRTVKAQPATSQIPFIIASNGPLPLPDIVRCFERGADDYIQYPVTDEELLGRIYARLSARTLSQRWTNRLLQQQTEWSQVRIARLNAALEIAQLGVWELTAQIGVWQNDPISAAIQLDDRCFEVFGVHYERAMGLDEIAVLIHPEDRSRVREQLNNALGMYSTGIFDVECRIVRPDGAERWVAMRGHEVRPEIARTKLVTLVGTLMDLTERKRTQALLIRSERVAALGQMAATLAHEINNPLAAVMNSLYLAKTNVDNREHLTRYLDMADEQVSQVAHITRKALGFYRENASPTQVSISAVVEETVRLLKGKIKTKNVIVEGRYTSEPTVVGVSGELRQVLSNLVANSLEAVAESGTIKIRVSTVVPSRNGSSCVRITVADDGKGIEPPVMAHLFEPLFTTKGVGGTGLGLWVSKQIVEKHGGAIRVRSRTTGPRRGTVFAVFLPATSPERLALQAPPAAD